MAGHLRRPSWPSRRPCCARWWRFGRSTERAPHTRETSSSPSGSCTASEASRLCLTYGGGGRRRTTHRSTSSYGRYGKRSSLWRSRLQTPRQTQWESMTPHTRPPRRTPMAVPLAQRRATAPRLVAEKRPSHGARAPHHRRPITRAVREVVPGAHGRARVEGSAAIACSPSGLSLSWRFQV